VVSRSGIRAVFVALLLFLLNPVAGFTAEPGMGTLLIASAKIGDARFKQSIILILQHGVDGTVGLIVNKPLPLTLAHVFPVRPQGVDGNRPLYLGGPVNRKQVSALFSSPDQPQQAIEILPDIFVSSADTFISDANNLFSWGKVRFFSGYAGWAPGQLEMELNQGSWRVAPVRKGELFDDDPQSLWDYLNGTGSGLLL